jgi:methionine S-methyltransferase
MSEKASGTGFLERCRKSSAEAYEAFKELLGRMESAATRGEAIAFFHSTIQPLTSRHSPAELARLYHFSVSELPLRLGHGGETRLLLLQLPSTFAPEEWSFTFFEGLTRYKVAEFQDRRVAELGCGIGWISIALAKQTRPFKVYGLDINPRAIVCSRINLYLNGFGADGKPTWQHEGRTLEDVVEFHASDLLEHCRGRKIALDRVIGCIPQVLNPDPDFTARMLQGSVQEHESDEFLHSLSNYAPQQGHLEDQFGLGLIARAVEESVDVLRGSGKLILNLGGRPGQNVLRQLFLRRGFDVRPVWSTRVSQAKDTDIGGLVAIEERTAHRFEFFVDNGGDAPVSARTALAFAEAGGGIAHALSVYEARLRDPQHVPTVLRLLRQPGYEDARRAIDLSYPEEALTAEKVSFLGALAEYFDGQRFFPYDRTPGLPSFRRHLGAFFRSYLKIHYEEGNFVIAPSIASVFRNLLALYRPKRALVDAHLARVSGAQLDPGVLEIPRDADLLCEMIDRIKPELVVYSLSALEARTRDSFVRILEVCARNNARVFFDVSELLELSSTPTAHGIFRFLSQNRLPPNAAMIGGLVKNRLYPDLETGFVVSENQDLLDHLGNAADLTYSRTPLHSQLYYDRILQDLLSFQLDESARGRPAVERALIGEDGLFRKAFVPLAAGPEEAFRHPAVVGERLARKSASYIRLDYGESTLPSPQCLKRGLFEAFAKMRVPADECDPSAEILELVWRRMGSASASALSHGVALGGGVAPLFAALAEDCARSGRALVFPAGAYGYFVATAKFYGARFEIAATHEEARFKLTEASLDEALKRAGRGAWVALSAPVVNPTGALYAPAEISALLACASRHDAVLVLDTIFSGLEHPGQPKALSGIEFGNARWAVLGGLSKEYAASGLRLGYGVSSELEVLGAWRKARLPQPDAALRFVFKKALSLWLRDDPELLGELEAQRKTLGERATRLRETLARTGWSPLPPQGGLFMVARPTGLLGRRSGKTVLTLENLADALRERTGIVINTPGWTGIPGYFRFVLSVTDAELEAALKGLMDFHEGLDR